MTLTANELETLIQEKEQLDKLLDKAYQAATEQYDTDVYGTALDLNKTKLYALYKQRVTSKP